MAWHLELRLGILERPDRRIDVATELFVLFVRDGEEGLAFGVISYGILVMAY